MSKRRSLLCKRVRGQHRESQHGSAWGCRARRTVGGKGPCIRARAVAETATGEGFRARVVRQEAAVQ